MEGFRFGFCTEVGQRLRCLQRLRRLRRGQRPAPAEALAQRLERLPRLPALDSGRVSQMQAPAPPDNASGSLFAAEGAAGERQQRQPRGRRFAYDRAHVCRCRRSPQAPSACRVASGSRASSGRRVPSGPQVSSGPQISSGRAVGGSPRRPQPRTAWPGGD
ncbi:hypothetical protein ACFPRL_14845 [Pseudoclavibacter helvolus]